MSRKHKHKTQPAWYSIAAKAGDDEADVMIYDVVGAGTTARQFVSDLKAITATRINLRMNTPGGSVPDGVAIFTALREHPAEVVCYVDGLAASIGSYIATAADRVVMARDAFMMIHNPAAAVFGDGDYLRNQANALEKMAGAMARAYADRSGKSEEEMRTLMSDETWYTAEEAVEAGFADEVSDHAAKMVAFSAPMNFNRMPDALRALCQTPDNAIGLDPLTSPFGGGAVAAPHKQETAMQVTAELFTEYAAKNPEAAEVKTLKASAFKAGKAEAHAEEVARMKSIVEACPGKHELAVTAFLAGQDAPTAKLTFDAVAKVELDAQAKLAAANTENARLVALAQAGGIGGIPATPEPATGEPVATPADEPKAKAEAEWQANVNGVQQKFTTKDRYVAIRKAELTGQFRAVQK